MTSRYLWRGILVVALSAALAVPARATTYFGSAAPIIVGIVAATAAIAVVITLVLLHESKKDRTITGCVSSGPNGLMIADERDKQVYALAGNTVGITPGERMSLTGKKTMSKGANQTRRAWLATNVKTDFGVCQP